MRECKCGAMSRPEVVVDTSDLTAYVICPVCGQRGTPSVDMGIMSGELMTVPELLSSVDFLIKEAERTWDKMREEQDEGDR